MNEVAPDLKRIFSLSLAHMLNDWYMNYIQTLLPFLVAAGLGVSKGAFLISAFTITSSLLQPVFGYLVDQKNQRWMVYVGTFWMAALLCLIGVIGNYSLLLPVVTLAGLGTAAFHPQASAMVTAVSGSRKGFMQAFFIAAGNIGWALTPLIAVPFIAARGLEATPWFVVPGTLVAILLWFTAPRDGAAQKAAPAPLMPVLRRAGGELSKVVAVVAMRSLAYFGLVAFLPLYLQERHISLIAGSRFLFVMLFAGAMGGLVGGYLSDRFGRKQVIVWSLVAASPLFYLFLGREGAVAYVLMALAGACLLSSFSVTIVLAQEIVRANAAMATGLMLGFSIGIGGLGVGLVGLLAEYKGLDYAIHLLIWTPFLAGLLALAIKPRGSSLPAPEASPY
ncbi:MAG: Fosmidomycin resistance protein [Syntrophaceae bacterium PtaU1.Bin231]|nr:MAG: Fosmidomycin resistance protein [Syntrophaceae bacterium PtaU1.Bin231]